nr:hypothetical protein [uncultured Fluviicola sp.]
MKNHFLILLVLIPFGARTQGPGFEFYYSVNHPLSSKEDRTFFGGGIGASVVFRDTKVFNFRTGTEVNYFHTWDESAYDGKMSYRRDLHYQYVVLSVPAFARLTFGDRFKWFLEAGAYVGICLGGNVQYTRISYGPSPNMSSTQENTESYRTGLSITPAASFGVRFPLSERIDFFLKPEFAVVKNNLGANNPFSHKNNYYGPVNPAKNDFDYLYMYVRFCAGIHLKPKVR